MSTITSQQDAEQENSDQIASEYVRVSTCWSTQDKFHSTAPSEELISKKLILEEKQELMISWNGNKFHPPNKQEKLLMLTRLQQLQSMTSFCQKIKKLLHPIVRPPFRQKGNMRKKLTTTRDT